MYSQLLGAYCNRNLQGLPKPVNEHPRVSEQNLLPQNMVWRTREASRPPGDPTLEGPRIRPHQDFPDPTPQGGTSFPDHLWGGGRGAHDHMYIYIYTQTYFYIYICIYTYMYGLWAPKPLEKMSPWSLRVTITRI